MDRDLITRRRAILHIEGERLVYSRSIHLSDDGENMEIQQCNENESLEDVENQQLHESNENVGNNLNEDMEIEQVANITVEMTNMSFEENNGEFNCIICSKKMIKLKFGY